MKRLEAVQFPAAALTSEVPMTRLERFALSRMILGNPPGKDGYKRKEMFEAILRDGYVPEEEQLSAREYDHVVKVQMTRAMIKECAKACEELAPLNVGRQAFAMFDLEERCKWILAGPSEATS